VAAENSDANEWAMWIGGFVVVLLAVGYFFGIGLFAGLKPDESEPDRMGEYEQILRTAAAQRGVTTVAPYTSPLDLDCADVVGPVWVGTYDPHGLDADGDGWGCDLG